MKKSFLAIISVVLLVATTSLLFSCGDGDESSDSKSSENTKDCVAAVVVLNSTVEDLFTPTMTFTDAAGNKKSYGLSDMTTVSSSDDIKSYGMNFSTTSFPVTIQMTYEYKTSIENVDSTKQYYFKHGLGATAYVKGSSTPPYSNISSHLNASENKYTNWTKFKNAYPKLSTILATQDQIIIE